MRGRRIKFLATVGTVAVVAIGATNVLGSDEHTPTYGKLSFDLSKDRVHHASSGSKPKVVYLYHYDQSWVSSGKALANRAATLDAFRKALAAGIEFRDANWYPE